MDIMKLPFKERTISTAVVIPSAIMVTALAVLQYRWSTRVSEATAVRLADSLQMSMINWQKDFFRYFSEIGLALRIDPVEDAPGDVEPICPEICRMEGGGEVSEAGFERLYAESDPDGAPAGAAAEFRGPAL